MLLGWTAYVQNTSLLSHTAHILCSVHASRPRIDEPRHASVMTGRELSARPRKRLCIGMTLEVLSCPLTHAHYTFHKLGVTLCPCLCPHLTFQSTMPTPYAYHAYPTMPIPVPRLSCRLGSLAQAADRVRSPCLGCVPWLPHRSCAHLKDRSMWYRPRLD